MKKEIANRILEILEGMDNRITDIEQSLENFASDSDNDLSFTAYGNEKEAIEEIRQLIKES